jgi:hypothetical protein
MPQQTRIFIGIGVGFLTVVVFVGWSVKTKTMPELETIIALFLRGVGLVVGFDLGYTVLMTPPQKLGVLNGSQIQIFVGSMAILWVAAAGIINTFRATGSNGNTRGDLQ